MFSLRLICGLALAAVSVSAANNHTSYTCDSPIYCEGDILHAVQMARLFSDSKTFVDMPTSKPEAQVIEAFHALGGVNATKEQIQQFLTENFLKAGSDIKMLTNVTIPELEWIDKVTNPDYRGWISHLNQAWTNLTFTFDTSQLCENCSTSILPVSRPFVVPGGRFREFYYWDSYFVIKGLLLSDQVDTARDMILNFFDFVETYGFIPNGARIYYLNRSQPPFLTQMVQEFWEKTGDDDFMATALPYLDKEYAHWMTNASISVQDPKDKRKHYKLNHYATTNNTPRPESYVEDYNTVNNGTDYTQEEKDRLYADIAAGAESGWDYSSRWSIVKYPAHDQIENYEMLRTINTANTIPIDLNSLLWNTESMMAEWYTQFGGKSKRAKRKSAYYQTQAKKRMEAIENLMWNETDYSFYDYNMTSKAQNLEFTPANLFPLWLGAIPQCVLDDKDVLSHVYDETENSLRKYPGILTTSYYNTTLQWDWPNGWPPLSYVAMEGMLRIEKYLNEDKDDDEKLYTTGRGTSIARLSYILAERYAASAYCGWYNTGGSIPGILEKVENATDDGHMFEKFDVNTIGVSGSQGEYVSQTGFGWTNGIALWIFDTFTNMTAPDCTETVILNI